MIAVTDWSDICLQALELPAARIPALPTSRDRKRQDHRTGDVEARGTASAASLRSTATLPTPGSAHSFRRPAGEGNPRRHV